MLELTPSLFGVIELEGKTLDVSSWYERKFSKERPFNKYIRFVFKTTWTTYRGYQQHATVYVNPQTLSASVNDKDGPIGYVRQLLADRYEWRKALGHGITPYGSPEEGKGKRAETYEATSLNSWLRKSGHTSQCTEPNNQRG